MIETRISAQDLNLINDWLKTNNIACPICSNKRFDISGSLAILPFFDLKTKNLILREGRPIIPLFCTNCGILTALTAHKALPHYFK